MTQDYCHVSQCTILQQIRTIRWQKLSFKIISQRYLCTGQRTISWLIHNSFAQGGETWAKIHDIVGIDCILSTMDSDDWCQLCRHWWHWRLQFGQTSVPPLPTKLASWRRSVVNIRSRLLKSTYKLGSMHMIVTHIRICTIYIYIYIYKYIYSLMAQSDVLFQWHFFRQLVMAITRRHWSSPLSVDICIGEQGHHCLSYQLGLMSYIFYCVPGNSVCLIFTMPPFQLLPYGTRPLTKPILTYYQ